MVAKCFKYLFKIKKIVFVKLLFKFKSKYADMSNVK